MGKAAMDAGRFQQVSDLFDAAWEQPASDRVDYVRSTAGDDTALADEALALLAEAATIEREDTRFATGGAGSGEVFQPLQPGARLGAWRVDALIGRGGMGEVYAAARDDGEYDQRAALKLVALRSPAARVRFAAERRILADLQHPNIAAILDGGTTDDDRPYMVIEYVDGAPITAHCDAHGLGVTDRLALFLTVCDAVSHAHARLVVHRDIKPSNVFVTEAGQVKLLDFGIAKVLDEAAEEAADATRTESVLTPAYAAPEQLTGEGVSTATDVYSLGALLFQLLAGRPALDAASTPVSALVGRAVAGDLPKASAVAAGGVPAARLAGDLDAIIARAMRRQPGARYPTVDALAEDIRAHLERRPVTARAGGRAYRTGRFLQRYAWQSAAAAAVAIALIVGALVSANYAAQTRDALATARAANAETEAALARARAAAASEANRARQSQLLVEAFTRVLGAAYEEVEGGPEVRAFLEDQRSQAMADHADGSADAAPLLLALSEVYSLRGDPQTVIDMLTPLAGDTDIPPRLLAGIQGMLGSALLNIGEPAAARPYLTQAIDYYQGQPGMTADALQHRSLLVDATGDQDLRHAFVDDATAYLTGPDSQGASPRQRGFLWAGVGFNQLRLNALEDAEAAMRKARTAYESAPGAMPAYLPLIIHNLGGVQYRLGRLADAAETFAESARLAERTGGRSMNLANSKRFLASLLIKLDRADEALTHLDDVDAMIAEFATPSAALRFYATNTRIRALTTLGRLDAAEALARETIPVAEQLRPDDAAVVGSCHYELANVLAVRGDTAGALAVLDTADTVFQGLGERRDQAMARNNKLRARLEGAGEVGDDA